MFQADSIAQIKEKVL